MDTLDTGPSGSIWKRFLMGAMGQPGNMGSMARPMPMPAGPMGPPQAMNPGMGMDVGPSMPSYGAMIGGGGAPRMPRITTGDMPSPTFGAGGPTVRPSPPAKRPMTMSDRMSTNRPGFWGKYNTLAQGLQGPAMSLLGLNNQGY